MFDEKWMNGTEDKPIETIEDALFLLASYRFCGGARCKTCVMHMYDHKDGNCGHRMDECVDFLFNKFGIEREGGEKG